MVLKGDDAEKIGVAFNVQNTKTLQLAVFVSAGVLPTHLRQREYNLKYSDVNARQKSSVSKLKIAS